jgi:hypothetical protein
MTPEALLRAARQARNDLDLDAIERGEKQRAAIRYVRVWRRDGMCGGSWAAPDEDGGLEIYTALKLLVAKKTNGPRFAEVAKNSKTSHGFAEPVPISKSTAQDVPEDDRSPEHIMADGFVQIFHNGLTADPSVVPGAGRTPVRVIVAEHVLTDPANTDRANTDRAANGTQAKPSGSAILEETLTPISFGKLGEYLCDGGTVGVIVDETGQIIDVGREQRLFTKQQRIGLGVRDGGCRYPGCEKPPSWCEAHHIAYWARDSGATDVANGILLCRYHHMLIHNTGWEIIQNTRQNNNRGNYWLKPPKEQHPNQQPIEMPTKNPLIAATEHSRRTQKQQLGNESVDLGAPLGGSTAGCARRPSFREKIDERPDVGLPQFRVLARVEPVQPAVPCGPPVPR